MDKIEVFEERARKFLLRNGIVPDTVDYKALLDMTLNWEENLNCLKEELNINGLSEKEQIKQMKAQELEYKFNNGFNFKEVLKLGSILIIGARGTGKTALGFRILEEALKNKITIYIYKHPRAELIKPLGFKILHSFEQLVYLNDCVVFVDEPQLVMPRHSNKNNEALQRLLSIIRQRNITMIFSTNDSRWVNKALESYIDGWFVKDIDYSTLKQGSKIKKIIRNNSLIEPEYKRLTVERFLFSARNLMELNGEYEFRPASFWNEDLSNAFALNHARNPE